MTTLNVGRSGAPYEVLVEVGKIREFATATKAVRASYWTDAAPLTPPTFLVTGAFWTQPDSSVLEQAGLEWSRLLSGGTEFVFDGPPPRAGDRLTATQRVDEVYTKQGRRGGTMNFTVFSTQFRRGDGSLAVVENHVTIETAQAARGDAEESPTPGPTPELPEAVRPTSLIGGPAALAVGDRLPQFVDEPVSRTAIVRYQGASGDLNPIHHDDAVAQGAGYPSVFSVGMFHAGILGSYLADLFGADSLRRFKVEFREQVWPGDVLTYGGVVAQRRTGGDDRDELDLELTAVRHAGAVHLRAWATVV